MNLAEGIGRRVATARVQRGLTRAQLAEAAGVSKMTIDRLENRRNPPGQVYAETIKAIAAALDVSADYLLGLQLLHHLLGEAQEIP